MSERETLVTFEIGLKDACDGKVLVDNDDTRK